MQVIQFLSCHKWHWYFLGLVNSKWTMEIDFLSVANKFSKKCLLELSAVDQFGLLVNQLFHFLFPRVQMFGVNLTPLYLRTNFAIILNRFCSLRPYHTIRLLSVLLISVSFPSFFLSINRLFNYVSARILQCYPENPQGENEQSQHRGS